MLNISVITASYNCENTIQETIESVISQTYKDWELIIVDDGSKDDSVNIIKKYCDKYDNIKLFTHAEHKNRGLKHTVKFAIDKCSGEYIHFCECDDILKENALEEKIKIIEKYPDVSIVFSEVEIFGEEACFAKYLKYRTRCINKLSNETYPTNIIKKSPNGNLIPTFSCVMCKKNDLEKCNFNTPIDAYLDWYLWSQLADKQIFYLPQELTKWRVTKNSYAQTFKGKNISLYKRHFYMTIKQNIYKNNSQQRAISWFIFYTKYFLQEIFSVRNSNNKKHKIITIAGFKVSFRRSIESFKRSVKSGKRK